MANILAVDDNLELCKLIRTTLERDGHRVETRQAGGALTEALCTAVSFFAACWLTLVPKNRTFAELARRMNIECGRIARESAEQDD